MSIATTSSARAHPVTQRPRHAAWQLGALAVLALAMAWSQAHAQSGHAGHGEHGTHGAAPTAQAGANASLSEGEITRRDARTGKLTIRHGEIANLDMPPMTMVFALQDPAQGSALQAGDKVRFQVENRNGALVITHIEAAAPAH